MNSKSFMLKIKLYQNKNCLMKHVSVRVFLYGNISTHPSDFIFIISTGTCIAYFVVFVPVSHLMMKSFH